jgi:hypothetical protein
VLLATGAAIVLLAWPGARGAAPWLPPRSAAPISGAALFSLPAPFLLAAAGGVIHAAIRVGRALRGATSTPASDDALFLACAGAALAGSLLAHAVPGARPILHALPLLSALAARTILWAALVCWPARAPALAAALALLTLYPGLRAAVRAHPHGASAWGELAGGAPGAASRGLPRQDGGEAVAAALQEVNDRAVAGARIWWPGVAPEAIRWYAREGRVRGDLRVAEAPAEADLAIVPLDGGSRDAEYRAWSAFRTARPVAGVYLDEVPLAFVYARAGAWR